uniref:Glycine rich antigen 1a n=1 Tax=Clonorchis sinensis TaxID=79923 RepID=G3BMD4_CLOSI|nr:glycine rich antigen 1a [Clonorchis sinensis]
MKFLKLTIIAALFLNVLCSAEHGGAQPPKSGDGGAQPPKSGDGGAQPPKSGDGGAQPPKSGDGGAQPPKSGDGGAQPPKSGAQRPFSHWIAGWFLVLLAVKASDHF